MFRLRCAAWTACALLPYTVLAATGDYEGKRIVSVRFEPARQPLLDSDLNKLVLVKTGEPLRLVNVTATIEQMYKSGRYRNIVAEAEATDGGVAITFITVQTSFISRVAIHGVKDPPNRGQLVNATKLGLGTEFNAGDEKQAEENILDVLRRNGFYNAQVRTEEDRDYTTEEIDLSFHITAGKRAKYDRPVIKGQAGRSDDSIIKTTRWRRFLGIGGYRQVTENTTQTGLDRLRQWYQNKDRLLARVTLDSLEYEDDVNRVKPTLTLMEGPKVEVRTSGAKLRRGKLQQLVPIYQEQAVDRDLLTEGSRNIRDYFQAQGYFDAEATYTLNPSDSKQRTDEQVIDYRIDRGARYRLSYLEITGNKYFTTETLRERMNVVPASFLRYRNGRYSEALLRRDIDALEDLYRSNGYRDVKITERIEDNYQGKPRRIAVFLTVEENQQSLVDSLTIEGVEPADVDYLRGILHSTEGQPYSDLNVSADQDEILNYYFNNGFADATLDVNVTPAAEPNRFQIKYTVHTGRQQFVRRVLVSGIQSTRPELIYDRISLQSGQPLSQSQQIESQRRLYDLGIFARVDTALQNPDGEEDNKYVLYRLEEASRYSLNFGLGAEFGRLGGGASTSLNNPGGSTGFSPRATFGISRLNFLGLGHTISLQTRASTIQQRALLTYLAPQFIGDPNLSLTVSAIYDNSKDVRTFAARREELSAQVSDRLSKADTIQFRLTYRRVSTSNVKITPSLIPLLAQTVRVGLVGATYIQDRRDDPTDSRRGIYNSVDVGIATGILGSQVSFGRVLGRNSTYHRLGRDLVFARSTNFGTIQQFASSSRDIPLPERFFAGGAVSHRGFPQNQAGPRDLSTGFPLGGTALLVNTVEMRFPLLGENIGGAVFHDAGNVYSKLGNLSFRYSQRDLTDFDYMVHVIGFGIRYRTPIGPVRVDLGYTLNPPGFFGCRGTIEDLLKPEFCDIQINPANFVRQQISHFQFHFNLGQAF